VSGPDNNQLHASAGPWRNGIGTFIFFAINQILKNYRENALSVGGCWSNRRKIQFFSVLLEPRLKPGGNKIIVREKIQ
jgi:hypothetical protein